METFWAGVYGACCWDELRSRAVRLRQMGWKPQEKGWKESLLEDELPILLKEDHSSFQGYAGAVAS